LDIAFGIDRAFAGYCNPKIYGKKKVFVLPRRKVVSGYMGKNYR
jgi:hypothetical protein